MSIRATAACGLAFLLVSGVGVVLLAQVQANVTSSPFQRIDSARVVFGDAQFTPCGDCHRLEWDRWKKTKHATGFDSLQRSPMAQEVLDSMGFRSAKRQGAPCMQCHFTAGPGGTAVTGVSCESCHGPARDWQNVHQPFEDGAKDWASETPAGKQKRLTTSQANGMLSPATDLYAVAANCFDCHTVPMERLVNRARHSAGTADFDLVNGVDSIRHNFIDHARTGTNRPMTVERARVMFVVGRILAVEYSLRGIAGATTDSGKYFKQMLTRRAQAVRRLEELVRVVSIEGVSEVLRVGTTVRPNSRNRAELVIAAEQIRGIGQRFAATTTGSTLAALDPFLRGEAVITVAVPSASEVGRAGAPLKAESAAKEVPPTIAAPSPTSGTPPVPPHARPALPGQPRGRPAWHSTEGRSGMSGADCEQCHAEAEAEMTHDPHAQAAKPLTGESPKARQIAELYGIGAAAMARPDKICMSCHATIDERTTSAYSEDGVTCEGCHGAAEKYLKPHQKGGNPQPGMRALKQARDRAQACSDCHRVSDERLLAAGHPSGEKYDLVSASKKIMHWPDAKPEGERKKRGQTYTSATDAALTAAFAAIVAARPIPNVTVVAAPLLPPRATTSASPPLGSAEASSAAVEHAPRAGQSSMPPRVPTALPSRASRTTVSIALEPLPATAGLTTEELMVLVKTRIARIHAAVRRID
jgi:hypothetical protein